MDKSKKGRWDWLPLAMPGVARLMRERRAELGDEFVNTCWARGMAGEPGWFFAREGAIAIGTPWNDPVLANFAASSVTATQALVLMRQPEVATHGA